MIVPHPLICHAIDTTAVAELLYDALLGASCRSELDEAFAPLGGKVRTWVAWLCGLHDLGKLSPAFQALRADVASQHLRGWAREDVARLHRARSTGGRSDTFHGDLTAHHFRRLTAAWGAPQDTQLILAQALGGHHGAFLLAGSIKEASRKAQDNGGPDWAGHVDNLVRKTATLFGLADPWSRRWSQVRLGLGASVALAGLTTVSDWIASGSIDRTTHAGADVDLVEYVRLSRMRAGEVVGGNLGWSVWRPVGDTSFRGLVGQEPRPMQRVVEVLAADAVGPGLVLIEAPTGEGKTKAALQCAITLIRGLGLAGFFLAMPTRATSNQAFDQVEDLLMRLDPTLSIKLLHGSAGEYLANRDAQGARLELARPADIGHDLSGGCQDDEVREWFTRIKGLLAPLAVGTVDRVLQGGIRARWAPVPLVGLSNRVVILDEVHAYELYMSTILDRLLWWLGWLGIPVILLTATLPSTRRQDLFQAWCSGAQRCRPNEVDVVLPVMTYPQVLWADKGGTVRTGYGEPSRLNRDRRIRLSNMRDEDLPTWAVEHAAAGRGVAIIHNLVARVSETRANLERTLASVPESQRPRIIEITGRLANARRAAVEAELRIVFGPGGSRAPSTGIIVVGTQVLEQSLDLDFDAIATDPAPMDNLIQRAGRLHRFREIDPDARPTLAIVGVMQGPQGPKWPSQTTRIYQDLVLLRTFAVLGNREELRLPEETSGLVDAVYSDIESASCPHGWERRWQEAAVKRLKSVEHQTRIAENLFLPAPTNEKAFTELTRHPKNRAQTRPPSYRGSHNG